MPEQQLTFDQYVEREEGKSESFLRKKICTSCGKKMEADEFRSTEDQCYWCRRLGMKKNQPPFSW